MAGCAGGGGSRRRQGSPIRTIRRAKKKISAAGAAPYKASLARLEPGKRWRCVSLFINCLLNQRPADYATASGICTTTVWEGVPNPQHIRYTCVADLQMSLGGRSVAATSRPGRVACRCLAATAAAPWGPGCVASSAAGLARRVRRPTSWATRVRQGRPAAGSLAPPAPGMSCPVAGQ